MCYTIMKFIIIQRMNILCSNMLCVEDFFTDSKITVVSESASNYKALELI